MSEDDDTEHPEHRGSSVQMVATTGAEKARIERALREAAMHVSRMPPTPSARDLQSKLESYRRTIESWDRRAPTTEDLRRLSASVEEVCALARMTSPTVRIQGAKKK
jgi:hypothetical protein